MSDTTITKKQTTGYKSDVLNAGGISMKDLGVGALFPREFSTGSVGLNHSGKVMLKCGEAKYNFQVSLNITLAHSKDGDLKRVNDETRAAFLAGKPKVLKDLGLENAVAASRIFNSGKVGFYLNGKCLVDGQLCQVGCSITAIGSDGKGWSDERPTERPAAE